MASRGIKQRRAGKKKAEVPKPEQQESAGNKLSLVYKRFCEELVAHPSLEAKATYKKIYRCSDKAAEAGSSRLMKNPQIQAYITELKNKRAERTQITADKVLQELARMAFSNISDYLTFGPGGVILKDSEKLTEGQLACISQISEHETERGAKRLSFKLYDKIKALELIGNHLAMFDKDRNRDADKEKTPKVIKYPITPPGEKNEK